MTKEAAECICDTVGIIYRSIGGVDEDGGSSGKGHIGCVIAFV